jgi:hypothetical protein
MSRFTSAEIRRSFVQKEIVVGAAEESLDFHNPCKEHSVCDDRQCVRSLGTSMVGVLLAMFLPRQQYQDHGKTQAEWWAQPS